MSMRESALGNGMERLTFNYNEEITLAEMKLKLDF